MGVWGSGDRTQKDRDFADEIASHLAHEEDANLARGLPPVEARRRARARFGNPRTYREQEWRYQSIPWIEDLSRDLRFALGGLKKAPGFSTIAVVMIAVGIGLNAAVFSVIDAVLLKPLPYPDPQQLVLLVSTVPRWASSPGGNIPRFSLLRQQTGVFQQVAAYDFGSAGLNLTGVDNPQQLHAVHVSADYFALFGAPFIAGRTFTPAEDSPNGGHVVVLSYGLWKSRYGGSPNIVGSSIQLDGQPYRVMGVVGPGFETDTSIDLWVPLQFDLNSKDWAQYFRVVARLKPGLTVPEANAQLRLVVDEFRKSYIGLVSFQQVTVGDTGQRLLVLWGAVAFVLLIACANVANLLLARGATRKREFATRAAVGAGRVQITRQLLVESLTLSLTGGLIGIALGFVAVRILLRMNPGDIPRIGDSGAGIVLDLHIVLFTLGISVLTGLVFGLVPAIAAWRGSLAAALNENGSHASMGIRRGKLRSALVVAEMAITVVLVIGAALLIRTFVNLEAVNPGFAMHNVISMSMSVSGDRFQKTAPLAQVVQEGTDRLHAVPGVMDAGVSNCLPMVDTGETAFNVVGHPLEKLPFTGKARACSISHGYFSTLNWSAGPVLPNPVARLAAAAVGSTVFAVGGNDPTGQIPFSTLLAFDPTQNCCQWISLPPMPTARFNLAASAVGGKLYVLGGVDSSGSLNVVEVYDPIANTWTTAAPMPTARGSFSVAILNGKIYAMGGGTSNVDVYDPSNDSWSVIAPNLTARNSPAAATDNNGVIYLFGGMSSALTLTSVEQYAPAPPLYTFVKN